MTNQTERLNGGKLSRRKFFKISSVAASAVALPYYIPASALGRGGAVAPSERIVAGGIGLGGRGSSDLRWMMAESDVQVVAICDAKKSQRDAVKKMVDAKYNNNDCATYIGIREFLAERTDINAMVIGTGDRWHAPASIMAMRAGKDVYCEKPGCFTIAQGRKVVEAAKQYSRIFQTGTQRLSEPNHVFAIQMARSGGLGEIHTAYADIRWRGGRGQRHDWLPEQPLPPKEEMDWDAWLGACPWRPYNAGYAYRGKGPKWNNFHDFATDVAQWGSHTIAQVLAGLDMSKASPVTFEFSKPGADIIARLASGVKIVLVRPAKGVKNSKYWGDRNACGERFDGSEGWAAAADGYSRPDVSSPAMLSEFKKVVGQYSTRTQRPMNHMRDFLNCVKSRRETVANPEVMFNSMMINLAADICERLQRNLKFDMHKAQFIDDIEANRMCSRAAREPWQI
ncbi:MAG: Gfo/Idh/MocA family oxidoreductase [Kiritimatiellia bacterium]|nr:Gfo/Idh/MocA family oxidoreductase [Kiritimatiellia bacterium]